MTSVQDIVDTLVELEAGDRGWIMEQLSAAQRQRLAAQLNDEPRRSAAADRPPAQPTRSEPATMSAPASAAPPASATPSTSAVPASQPREEPEVVQLSRVSAQQLADIVRREPAWVVQAVLAPLPRERRQDVLAHLSPGIRAELARVAATESITPAVRRFLLKAAARRLNGSDSAVRDSRFDRLVDTMRSRLRWLPRLRRAS
jgi:hypothetical protein